MPPTAVDHGESAGALTVGGRPSAVKSPVSPEEKLAEIPVTAALSEMKFRVSRKLVGRTGSGKP
jgi:hypothetical protein